MKIKVAWWIFKEAIDSWLEDFAPSMGAALSYYTLFSIAPLLVIIIAVAGLFFGVDDVRGALLLQLSGMVGDEGAAAVEQMLEAANHPTEGTVGTIVSAALLFIGATTVFGELQNALDRIWQSPMREETSSWWILLRTRLLSFGLILAIAFLLIISLVVTAVLSALGKWWDTWFGAWEILAQVFNFLVSFGLITVLFALIYKFIPRARIRWHDVWIGAAVTSLLFTIGKSLIGLYIGKSDVASGFGPAGSLVILMVWVYYSAQIFLVGAEFTWVYAHRYGSRRGTKRPQRDQTEKSKAVSHKPAQSASSRS